MIKILITTLISSILLLGSENDSLFWFDANILNKELPQFPLIINKVLVGEYMPSNDLKYETDQIPNEVFEFRFLNLLLLQLLELKLKDFKIF